MKKEKESVFRNVVRCYYCKQPVMPSGNGYNCGCPPFNSRLLPVVAINQLPMVVNG